MEELPWGAGKPLPEGTGGWGLPHARLGCPGAFQAFASGNLSNFREFVDVILNGFLFVCFKSWFMDAISSRSEEGEADAEEGLGTGLPQPERAEPSDGHTWAGRTGLRSCIASLLPTRRVFPAIEKCW